MRPFPVLLAALLIPQAAWSESAALDPVAEAAKLYHAGQADQAARVIEKAGTDKEMSDRVVSLYLVCEADGAEIRCVPLRLFHRKTGEVYTQIIGERSPRWNIIVRHCLSLPALLDYWHDTHDHRTRSRTRQRPG